MISACTLFDSRFSTEGWLCWKSINLFAPTMKFYVLCLDERVYHEAQYLRQRCGDIIPIRLYEFENHFKQLLKSRDSRPWNAYTQTCKVFLPTYIFEHFSEDKLFYVDSDLYFWSDPNQIDKELGKHSFMVTSRELDPPPKQGRFNGGFFACKNDKCAKTFFGWWQERTVEWCLWHPGPGGKFTEEGYLNIFHDEPNKFQNVLVSQHPGINLANWNLNKHELSLVNKNVVIDNYYPLICYHYQGLRIYKDKYESCADTRNQISRYIYDRYYKEYLLFREEFLNGLDSYRWR